MRDSGRWTARGPLVSPNAPSPPERLKRLLVPFVFSLIALPLFLQIRKPLSMRMLGAVARFAERAGALYLFAIPLALVGALPDVGGKNPVYYFALFLAGYALAAQPRFWVALGRRKAPALLLAVATVSISCATSLPGSGSSPCWATRGAI